MRQTKQVFTRILTALTVLAPFGAPHALARYPSPISAPFESSEVQLSCIPNPQYNIEIKAYEKQVNQYAMEQKEFDRTDQERFTKMTRRVREEKYRNFTEIEKHELTLLDIQRQLVELKSDTDNLLAQQRRAFGHIAGLSFPDTAQYRRILPAQNPKKLCDKNGQLVGLEPALQSLRRFQSNFKYGAVDRFISSKITQDLLYYEDKLQKKISQQIERLNEASEDYCFQTKYVNFDTRLDGNREVLISRLQAIELKFRELVALQLEQIVLVSIGTQERQQDLKLIRDLPSDALGADHWLIWHLKHADSLRSQRARQDDRDDFYKRFTDSSFSQLIKLPLPLPKEEGAKKTTQATDSVYLVPPTQPVLPQWQNCVVISDLPRPLPAIQETAEPKPVVIPEANPAKAQPVVSVPTLEPSPDAGQPETEMKSESTPPTESAPTH